MSAGTKAETAPLKEDKHQDGDSSPPEIPGVSGTVRSTIKEINNFLDTHTWAKVLAVIFFVILLGGFIFLFVWMIHLYVKFDGQACDQPLSLWCLVAGVTGLSSLFLLFVYALADKWVAWFLGIFSGLLVLFAFGWTVLGAYWTFSEGFTANCPDPLFDFVWYYNFTVIAVAAALFMLVFAAAAVILPITTLGNDSESPKGKKEVGHNA